MSTLVRPDTAFSTDRLKRQRSPRQRKNDHLAWIRTLPSVVPSTGPVEAAHIRYRDELYAKPGTGLQQKPNDCWVVPLAHDAHADQHAHGDERAWWDGHQIDPVIVAAFLWCHSGDDLAGATIIRNATRLRR